ncbi:BrnT family toxin [Rhizobium leguminosarum]|uniref:BrnT family toxin n=1 Tax=Rhizobium leguminosarum TaxID=384 RepID=UPI0021BC0C66|nr:BrnT family toxin [Rhizobium leguminosarum]
MPRFQWNDEKNRTNKAKHGVSFETACLIWNDPQYLLIPDAVYDGEQRWLAIGVVVLVTVYWSPSISSSVPRMKRPSE